MTIAIATTEFVSENNFDGGLANYTYKLCKWLIARGHSIQLYMPNDDSSKKTDRYSKFENISICEVAITKPNKIWYQFIDKTNLGRRILKRKGYYIYFENHSRCLNNAITNDHKKMGFDIIHYPHLSGLALLRPKNIPCVIRLSSSTALCQQMGGYGVNDEVIKAQEQVELKAMKLADAIFGPSKMVIKITEKLINKKIELIETPFMPPTLSLDENLYYQNLNNKKYALFFGSIGLIKGVGTISEMIFELLGTYKDLHFVFVGKKLNNTIAGKPVWDYLIEKGGPYSDRIIYFESLKHNQLFPIIKNSQVVVLPSRTDNFPNTCIEAMANNKIVIGTNGNGFDQLIENGVNGYLINVDDSKELLNKIKLVLSLSKTDKEKMETLAGKRIEKLNPDIVLNEVLNLYKKILK